MSQYLHTKGTVYTFTIEYILAKLGQFTENFMWRNQRIKIKRSQLTIQIHKDSLGFKVLANCGSRLV